MKTLIEVDVTVKAECDGSAALIEWYGADGPYSLRCSREELPSFIEKLQEAYRKLQELK